MENTLTGRADDSPEVLEIFKNEPQSRSVNNSFQQLALAGPGPKQHFFFYQPELRPDK